MPKKPADPQPVEPKKTEKVALYASLILAAMVKAKATTEKAKTAADKVWTKAVGDLAPHIEKKQTQKLRADYANKLTKAEREWFERFMSEVLNIPLDVVRRFALDLIDKTIRIAVAETEAVAVAGKIVKFSNDYVARDPGSVTVPEAAAKVTMAVLVQAEADGLIPAFDEADRDAVAEVVEAKPEPETGASGNGSTGAEGAPGPKGPSSAGGEQDSNAGTTAPPATAKPKPAGRRGSHK